MGLIHVIAGMMGRVCSSAIGAYARRLARSAPAGSPMRCTAWIFQFDPISAKLIDDIGVDTMLWGSDG